MTELLFILSRLGPLLQSSAILGQHPRMDGLQEMNLLLTECMAEWWAVFHWRRVLGANRMLRAVVQLYYD